MNDNEEVSGRFGSLLVTHQDLVFSQLSHEEKSLVTIECVLGCAESAVLILTITSLWCNAISLATLAWHHYFIGLFRTETYRSIVTRPFFSWVLGRDHRWEGILFYDETNQDCEPKSVLKLFIVGTKSCALVKRCFFVHTFQLNWRQLGEKERGWFQNTPPVRLALSLLAVPHKPGVRVQRRRGRVIRCSLSRILLLSIRREVMCANLWHISQRKLVSETPTCVCVCACVHACVRVCIKLYVIPPGSASHQCHGPALVWGGAVGSCERGGGVAAGAATEREAEGEARKTTETSEGAPTHQAEVSETGKLTHWNTNFKQNRQVQPSSMYSIEFGCQTLWWKK